MKQHFLPLILWLAVYPLLGCGGGTGVAAAPPSPGVTPSPEGVMICGLPIGLDRGQRGDTLPRYPGEAGDAVEFSEGGMAGHTVVRWDPRAGRLLYESARMGRGEPPEKWERQPSRDEWAGFWAAVDAAGVWNWKADYGQALHTDCVGWRLALRHDGKSMSSTGCSMGPDAGAYRQVVEALTRPRGDASAASEQALLEVKHLQQSKDWDDRIQTVRRLASLGARASGAVPALVDLLGAPPSYKRRAAPGREPIAVAREVRPLVNTARLMREAKDWDKAIALYDQVLARDPQHEQAALGRATAIETRDEHRQQAARGASGASPEGLAARESAHKQMVLTAAAVDALVAVGEPALPALIEALRDKNPQRARRTADVLGQMPSSASLSAPALARALRDPVVRIAAARALLRIAPQDDELYLPVLMRGVDDPDADNAVLSVAALAQIGTPAVLPALMHALHDNRTREIAMRGLSRMGPLAAAAVPEVLDSLVMTREASEEKAAEQALKAMGAAAVPGIVDVLRNDKEAWRRNVAVQALARLGPEASGAVPALIDTFRYGNTLSANATEALGQIGAAAVPALTAALKCDRLPPAPAPSFAAPWEPQTLYPETEYVRINAAIALAKTGGPAKAAAMPALREARSDASPRVREAAEFALRALERR